MEKHRVHFSPLRQNKPWTIFIWKKKRQTRFRVAICGNFTLRYTHPIAVDNDSLNKIVRSEVWSADKLAGARNKLLGFRQIAVPLARHIETPFINDVEGISRWNTYALPQGVKVVFGRAKQRPEWLKIKFGFV